MRLRFPWSDRETRSASYTDALVEAIVRQSGGSVTAVETATGALETAAGLTGRAFASAEPSGTESVKAAITPEVLLAIGRDLIRLGESVHAIDTAKGLRLIPANTWTITGGYDPDTWEYKINLPGPSRTVTREVSAAGVVHVRYAVDPAQPWAGLSPLQVASLTGRLSAETESALGDESAGPRGNLLPVPKDGDSPTLEPLREALGKLRGKAMLVESAFNWQDDARRGGVGPDWTARRLGADPPAALVQLYGLNARQVLAACGVPIELVELAGSTGNRESWRRYLFGTVAPLGRIVSLELSRKLEEPITLQWDELRASDLAGRARAFQSMVGAGMALERAAALAGLMEPEG